MTLNALDILLVALVLLSALNGWRRGFIMGLLDLLGWIVSLVAALRFYQPVARWFGARVVLWSEVWDQPLAFILIAVSAGLAVHLQHPAACRLSPAAAALPAFHQVW